MCTQHASGYKGSSTLAKRQPRKRPRAERLHLHVCPAAAVPDPEETHLQADGQVHSAAEGGAHGPRVQTQVFEELREGLRERYPRPLLGHHHTRPHARQVQSSRLQVTAVRGQPSGARGGAPLLDGYTQHDSARTSLRGLRVPVAAPSRPGPAILKNRRCGSRTRGDAELDEMMTGKRSGKQDRPASLDRDEKTCSRYRAEKERVWTLWETQRSSKCHDAEACST